MRNVKKAAALCALMLALAIGGGGSLLYGTRTSAAAAETVKVIADWDTYYSGNVKTDRLVPTDEAAFPHGRMFHINQIGDNWCGDMGLRIDDAAFPIASTRFSGAEYMSVYISNRSGEAVDLCLALQVHDNKQYTLKELTDYVRLDDVQGNVTQVSTGVKQDVWRPFTVPAGFVGYVRIPLVEENFEMVWPEAGHAYANSRVEGIQIWSLSGEKDIYMDTIVLGYGDDIDTPLTLATAAFGRVYTPKHDSGKYIVDGYDDSPALTARFNTVQTTESDLPSVMWAPASRSDDAVGGEWWTDEIPLADNRDWLDIDYFMLYADNRSETSATVSIGFKSANTQYGGDLDYRIKSGGKVYLDNLADPSDEVAETTVTGGVNTYIWTGFQLPEGFRGYIKVPFTNENFQTKEDSLNSYVFAKSYSVKAVHVMAFTEGQTADKQTHTVFFDTLSVSYDDDLTATFDGGYENEPAFDGNDGAVNEVRAIERNYWRNRNRDYWDGSRSPFVPGNTLGNTVVYDENYRYMTVTFNGSVPAGGEWYMWGNDNLTLHDNRDWSEAKYFVAEVKNLRSETARFGWGVSTRVVSGDGNHTVPSGTPYYVRSTDGTVTRMITKDGVYAIPGDFEGWLVVPVAAYGDRVQLEWVTRFNYWFSQGCSLTVRFGQVGYATSDTFLSAADFAVKDKTSYEYRDWTTPEISPARPTNEPTESLDNRTE